MSDDLQTQLKNVLNAINAQKALRGTLPNEQISQTLDTLYQKKAELEAQIATSTTPRSGSGSVQVTGNVGGSINTGTIQAGGDVVGRDKTTTFHGETAVSPPIRPLDSILAPLYNVIMEHFNLSEVRLELAFPLGIDLETLTGSNKQEKVYALLQRCQRQGLVDKLMSRCREARPRADWGA